MDTTTYLYRLYDDSQLLYVGITHSISERFGGHRSEKHWWNKVKKADVTFYSTRTEALNAERIAIKTEYPVYNLISGVSEEKLLPVLKMERKPGTHSSLPREELDYLKTLDNQAMYQRCAELWSSGWSYPSIAQGAKISPTASQLSNELKYIIPKPTGHPVPTPPLQEKERRKQIKDNRPHLSSSEKTKLINYANISKTLRAHHTPGHPVWEAVEEYRQFVVELRDKGIFASEMAKAAGVNETAILRRIREGRK